MEIRSAGTVSMTAKGDEPIFVNPIIESRRVRSSFQVGRLSVRNSCKQSVIWAREQSNLYYDNLAPQLDVRGILTSLFPPWKKGREMVVRIGNGCFTSPSN